MKSDFEWILSMSLTLTTFALVKLPTPNPLFENPKIAMMKHFSSNLNTSSLVVCVVTKLFIVVYFGEVLSFSPGKRSFRVFSNSLTSYVPGRNPNDLFSASIGFWSYTYSVSVYISFILQTMYPNSSYFKFFRSPKYFFSQSITF